MLRAFVLPATFAAVLWISAAAVGAETTDDKRDEVSFRHDVLPLLTRLGCNSGGCHGKPAGQNGFRLSLRGYAPQLDHEWITREFQGRRINRPFPAESLLLRKAGGKLPHHGGWLFTKDSREYRTLVAWIEAGTPGIEAGEPTVERIEVLPEDDTVAAGDTIAPGESQQLTVRAHFSDGAVRDVTWLSQFFSCDEEMIEVSPNGLATCLAPGETVVRVHYQQQVEIVTFTAPYPHEVTPRDDLARVNKIDDHVYDKLAAMHIPASPPCGESVFVRRVYIDTIGRLPTPEEVQSFNENPRMDKRGRLIDDLLERPEFVDYWTFQLNDLLQNRKQREHDVRGLKGVRSMHYWLRGQVAANRPWNEIARDVLTSEGDSFRSPQIGFYIVAVGEHDRAEESEVAGLVAESFLGTRIGCAKCHNHPAAGFTQDDYYRFAAFFSNLALERRMPDEGPTELAIRKDEPPLVRQPRTGEMLAPRPLDGSEIEIAAGEDPRRALVDWMTNPANEYFSGNMVNRLWKHFLKEGLVEPVDDLRASNPPSNRPLWDYLNREFVASGFDLKHVMRLILNSQVYQLSSETSPENAAEQRFYSRYYPRRIPAEVLADAISDVTAVPYTYDGYPRGVRALQMPSRERELYTLTAFGRPERVVTSSDCERNAHASIPQVLHLLNGDGISEKLHSEDGWLIRTMIRQMDDKKLIDAMFLRMLARLPNAEEKETIDKHLAKSTDRAEALADVMWAILNTKEFLFNQ